MGRGKRSQRRPRVSFDDSYTAYQRALAAAEDDPEQVRCCPAPDFAAPRGNPYRQRCRTCGTWLRRELVAFARTLEARPASRCKHAEAEPLDLLGVNELGPAYQCPRCRLCWRHRPKPHEAGEEFADFHKRWLDDWEVATGLVHLRMRSAATEAAKPRPRARTSALAEG